MLIIWAILVAASVNWSGPVWVCASLRTQYSTSCGTLKKLGRGILSHYYAHEGAHWRGVQGIISHQAWDTHTMQSKRRIKYQQGQWLTSIPQLGSPAIRSQYHHRRPQYKLRNRVWIPGYRSSGITTDVYEDRTKTNLHHWNFLEPRWVYNWWLPADC
jgi:hypothetical protein